MHKGLLAWNIILTIIVVTGCGLGYYLFEDYRVITEERILTVSQSLQELNGVVVKHAETINQQAASINSYVSNVNEEYTAALKENKEVIQEMNGIMEEYQQIVNDNAAYLEKILENLEQLSITILQSP